jgi:hypothetical protein
MGVEFCRHCNSRFSHVQVVHILRFAAILHINFPYRFIKEVHPAAVIESMGRRSTAVTSGHSIRKRDSSTITAVDNCNTNPLAVVQDDHMNESILTDRKSSFMMRNMKSEGSESLA